MQKSHSPHEIRAKARTIASCLVEVDVSHFVQYLVGRDRLELANTKPPCVMRKSTDMVDCFRVLSSGFRSYKRLCIVSCCSWRENKGPNIWNSLDCAVRYEVLTPGGHSFRFTFWGEVAISLTERQIGRMTDTVRPGPCTRDEQPTVAFSPPKHLATSCYPWFLNEESWH